MIQLTDNFNSFNYKDTKYIEISKNKRAIGNHFHITLKDYKDDTKNFILFKSEDSEDELIISIKKTQIENEDKYTAQTGNYVGRFRFNGVDIDIKSRFSDIFLKRMLNFANDVYLDDVDVSGKVTKEEDIDYSKFILYYLFIQTLEKAFLLGLPKSYTTIKHHDMKLKGNVDINRFIKHDIPFRGKISSVSREQKEIQEIIDILYKTVAIIEKSNQISTKNISHIKTHLKQHKSNNFVSNQTIQKALNSKALNNPIFAPYKKVLEYAKYIINANSLEQNNGKEKTYGFVVNVAMLFEIYMTKLLRKEFSEWDVSSPKIGLYESNFFKRRIIPDIVMEKDNKVLVFDTKYKKMIFNERNQYGAGDVDRNDFFQINTYMAYYQQSAYELVAGGLLYPMEKLYDESQCFSDSWLGNHHIKFVVDGIELKKLSHQKSIPCREKRFIERVQKLINKR